MLDDSHLAQIFRTGYAELNRLGKSLESRNLLDLSVNPEVLLENVDRAIQGGMTVSCRNGPIQCRWPPRLTIPRR